MAKVNSSLLAGLNESLLEKTKETNKVVFYLEVNSQIYETFHDVRDLTAGEVIYQVVKKLNKEKELNLKEDEKLYELYGAKKSGKKKSDLPAIQHEQMVSKTNIKRFNISPIYSVKNSTDTKTSLTSIKSEMGLGPNKTTKNDEIVDEEKVKKGFFACFCLKYGFK